MDEVAGRKLRELFGPSRETGVQRRLRHEREEARIMGLFEGGVTAVSARVLTGRFDRLGFEDEEQVVDAVRRLEDKGAIRYDGLRRVLVKL